MTLFPNEVSFQGTGSSDLTLSFKGGTIQPVAPFLNLCHIPGTHHHTQCSPKGSVVSILLTLIHACCVCVYLSARVCTRVHQGDTLEAWLHVKPSGQGCPVASLPSRILC